MNFDGVRVLLTGGRLTTKLDFLPLHTMGIRSVLAKPFAAYIAGQTKEWSGKPGLYQRRVFESLLQGGRATLICGHPQLR